MWIHNGTDIKQRNYITYSPPMLNHSLMISNARIGDSGVYTCRSCHAANTLIEKNITVEVIADTCIANKHRMAGKFGGKVWRGKTLANLAIHYEFAKNLPANYS